MTLAEAPEVFVECAHCGGDGVIRKSIWVYEHGCGFGHEDVLEAPCRFCNGAGGFLCEAAGDRLEQIEEAIAKASASDPSASDTEQG